MSIHEIIDEAFLKSSILTFSLSPLALILSPAFPITSFPQQLPLSFISSVTSVPVSPAYLASVLLSTQDVMISFSFALVSATYKTLISSLNTSLLIFSAMMLRCTVVILILLSVSIYFIPIPTSGSTTRPSFVSLRLNLVPSADTKHTGNSSPLLLCMLII